MSLDTADAAGLAELLQFPASWAASDPSHLGASLQPHTRHHAHGTQQLQGDLHRFAFLPGGNDGELLSADEQDLTPPAG